MLAAEARLRGPGSECGEPVYRLEPKQPFPQEAGRLQRPEGSGLKVSGLREEGFHFPCEVPKQQASHPYRDLTQQTQLVCLEVQVLFCQNHTNHIRSPIMCEYFGRSIPLMWEGGQVSP